MIKLIKYSFIIAWFFIKVAWFFVRIMFYGYVLKYKVIDFTQLKIGLSAARLQWLKENASRIKYFRISFNGEEEFFGVMVPRDIAIMYVLKFGP